MCSLHKLTALCLAASIAAVSFIEAVAAIVACGDHQCAGSFAFAVSIGIVSFVTSVGEYSRCVNHRVDGYRARVLRLSPLYPRKRHFPAGSSAQTANAYSQRCQASPFLTLFLAIWWTLGMVRACVLLLMPL